MGDTENRMNKIMAMYLEELSNHNIELIKKNVFLENRVHKLEILLKQHEISIPEEDP